MPTLRTMIDNETRIAAATAKPASTKASPLANHVASHLQDPVGETKEGFDDLNQKQLEYELAKQNMERQLAPVESVISHVKQTHGIGDDEEGDEEIPGVPNNRPGQVNQQPNNMKPGQQVSQPGTGPAIPQQGNAPSTAKQAVPAKQGQAAPGQVAPGQAPVVQQKKPAPGKKGAKVDPRKIKVHVTAEAAPSSSSPSVRPSNAGMRTMATGLAQSSLRFPVQAGGPGSGRHPGYGTFKHTGGSPTGFRGPKTHEYSSGKVRVKERHPSDPKYSSSVHETSSGTSGFFTTTGNRVFKGSPDEVRSFMKERYGITSKSK